MAHKQTWGTSGYGSGLYGNQPIETMPIGYYIDLLTSEYRSPNSPKFNAFLYLLAKKFDDVSQCLVQMDTVFDVDYALGVQLDVCGAIAGANRKVGFQPTGGASPILDDTTYRLYIKAKIARNQWDGSIESLQKIWKSLFPGGTITITDNQDMTANISLSGSFPQIVKDLINNGYIVPRPEGVLYNYGFSNLPVFGFDLNNAYEAGFDLGKFA